VHKRFKSRPHSHGACYYSVHTKLLTPFPIYLFHLLHDIINTSGYIVSISRMICELWNEIDLKGRCHGLIWSTSSAFAWKDSRKATNHIGQVTKSMGLEPTASLIQRSDANCLNTSFSVMYPEIRILPANLHALCLPQGIYKKFSGGQIVTLEEYILLSIFKSQITVY